MRYKPSACSTSRISNELSETKINKRKKLCEWKFKIKKRKINVEWEKGEKTSIRDDEWILKKKGKEILNFHFDAGDNNSKKYLTKKILHQTSNKNNKIMYT